MNNSIAIERRFLFLQGNVSQFFRRLGSALIARGHQVRRINFHAGDRMFWRLPGAVDYQNTLDHWPSFFETKLKEWRITDLVLFGDCRPLHRAAIEVATRWKIPVYVFEEGYLRPNWITLEQGGVNGYSPMRRDAAWFRDAAKEMPPWIESAPIQNAAWRRVAEDVLYHAVRLALSWQYPGYRTHRPWPASVEFAGKLCRFARQRVYTRRRDAEGLRTLTEGRKPYYFFPLQLDSDSQIREHSHFGSMEPALSLVIDSFACNAPSESLLVIKEHPLDNGVRNWRELVRQNAVRAQVSDRTIYLEKVDVEWLTANAKGVVTVNSTVGSRALAHGVPIITLGRSIYDIPELTFRGALDDFWQHSSAPCQETFDAFRRVLAAQHMINGSFFSEDGLALAVTQSVARLESLPHRPTHEPVFVRQETPLTYPSVRTAAAMPGLTDS